MLVFYLYSGTYVSESVCGCFLYVWCMRDELEEFHLFEKLSQILYVWACIK